MSISLKTKGNTANYNEHYLLGGLDVPNQHPIEVIIGLRDELDKRYIKPLNGIPASDLADTYINIDELNAAKSEYQSLYAQCKSSCSALESKVDVNISNTEKNTTDIFNLNGSINDLKSKLSSIPGINDSFFTGAVCIKQKLFTATDTNKSCDIIIMDTDLKVIEPTIVKSDGTVAKFGSDYTITYPDDVTLRVLFITNGDYKINYISGEISDTEFNILLDYYKKLEAELYLTSGSYYKPAHDIQLVYDIKDRVIKEIYTGNINKVIDYEYDDKDNVIKKTVTQDSLIKIANYQYDSNNKLVTITDNGTDIPLDGTRARAYNLQLNYDTVTGLISKEIYTGDINKNITYERNNYGDITKKTVVEDGITKTANYIYDENRRLININDDGTETVAVVFRDSGNSNTGTGTTTDIGVITEPEIDLIFETIFND